MNAPAGEKTKDELLEEAREADIEGRSSMNKDELEAALAEQDAPAISSRRAPQEATNPKTGPVPPAGVPTSPVNPERPAGALPAPNRSASRVISSRDRRAARRERLEREAA